MSTSYPPSILFVAPTATAVGGVQTWLDEVSAFLARAGWNVRTALLQGCVAHDVERYRRNHPALDTVLVDGRGLNADGRQRAVMRCLHRLNPDLCIPLTAVDAHEGVCRAKADGWRGRYVLSVRGNVPKQLADARRHVPYADAAICPGVLTCRILRQFGIPEDRMWHIPNGSRAAAAPRRERPAGDDILRVGYVGRLAGGEKRAGDLLGCAEALVQQGAPCRLKIVGDGPLADRLRDGVRDRGLSSCVSFTGLLGQAELFEKVYPELDVLVLFSESEAFGIVLVEAMKHGVVPVSSRFLGCAAEGLLREGLNARLFEVGDTTAAARRIADLANCPAEWRRLSQAAQAAAMFYTWERCGQHWMDVLEQVRSTSRRDVPVPPLLAPDVDGFLGRLGVPTAAADVMRRLRRRVEGIPRAQVGGEEWPFASHGGTAEELATIQALAVRLDCSAEPGTAEPNA